MEEVVFYFNPCCEPSCQSRSHHLSALLFLVRVLEFSIHDPRMEQSVDQTDIRSPHVLPAALLLRVCGLPYASQFVRLHCSAAGQLQQPLDVEEDGRLVVGQRKLHLPGGTEPGHLRVSKHEDKLVELKF